MRAALSHITSAIQRLRHHPDYFFHQLATRHNQVTSSVLRALFVHVATGFYDVMTSQTPAGTVRAGTWINQLRSTTFVWNAAVTEQYADAPHVTARGQFVTLRRSTRQPMAIDRALMTQSLQMENCCSGTPTLRWNRAEFCVPTSESHRFRRTAFQKIVNTSDVDSEQIATPVSYLQFAIKCLEGSNHALAPAGAGPCISVDFSVVKILCEDDTCYGDLLEFDVEYVDACRSVYVTVYKDSPLMGVVARIVLERPAVCNRHAISH